MSHRHGDHMGGMAHLLSVNPKVKIYAPKEGFGVYGADLPSTFYRKDASLPPAERYYDGAPPAVMRFGAAWPGANFELIDKTTEIAPGIHLIALVSDKPGTLELRELSLAINTPDGMVIVVGCSHPGIDKIVAARGRDQPTNPLHRRRFPSGGIQRPGNRKDRRDSARYLQSGLRGAWPLHRRADLHRAQEGIRRSVPLCRAGHRARARRQAAGAHPIRRSTFAMDEEDLRTYRALLAQSDDIHDEAEHEVRLAQER